MSVENPNYIPHSPGQSGKCNMSLTTNRQREAVGSAGDGSKGGGRRVRGGRRGRRRRPPVENKPGEVN